MPHLYWILGVLFAAVFTAAFVRVINRPTRRTKWAVSALSAIPLCYVLSFGPACWLAEREAIPGWLIPTLPIYEPLVTQAVGNESGFGKALNWYTGSGLLHLSHKIEMLDPANGCPPEWTSGGPLSADF